MLYYQYYIITKIQIVIYVTIDISTPKISIRSNIIYRII